MKEGQRKRRGFKIVTDTILKYKNKLTKSDKQQLISALKRQLIIQRKGFIFFIDSEESNRISLADLGSYEFGISSLKRKRKPIEIISDIIRHNHAHLSNRDYENLIIEIKNLK